MILSNNITWQLNKFEVLQEGRNDKGPNHLYYNFTKAISENLFPANTKCKLHWYLGKQRIMDKRENLKQGADEMRKILVLLTKLTIKSSKGTQRKTQ